MEVEAGHLVVRAALDGEGYVLVPLVAQLGADVARRHVVVEPDASGDARRDGLGPEDEAGVEVVLGRPASGPRPGCIRPQCIACRPCGSDRRGAESAVRHVRGVGPAPSSQKVILCSFTIGVCRRPCLHPLLCPTPLRDRAPDPTSAQVGTVLPGAVRLVGTHSVRPLAGTPQTLPWDPDVLQDRFELRGIPALPGRDHNRHGLLPLLDREMDLGGQPTSRAPETVVVRLDLNAAGRLLLKIPLLAAPAACWWARQIVESTLTSQVIRSFASAWACSSVKTRFHVPSRWRRRNRS